jgi:hypothetical protein
MDTVAKNVKFGVVFKAFNVELCPSKKVNQLVECSPSSLTACVVCY